MLRVGVIGTGFGGRVVAPAFSRLSEVDVLDVVSARDDEAVARLCGRADLDLVCVHSPPFLHERHVAMAVEAGHVRAVLCDKPMGTDPDSSARMLALAEEAATLHYVNFEFRFLDARREVRSIISSGEIGDPVQLVWSHFSTGTSRPLRHFGWLFERESGGGWIGAWASHAVDTVRWLLGEVRDVHAVSGTRIMQRPDADGALHDVTAEDSLSCVLVTDQDRVAMLASSFASPAEVTPRILVVGTAGSVECVDDGKVTLTRADGTVRQWLAPPGERHMRAMGRWAEVIRDSVTTGRQDGPSFADGLACDRVLRQLRESPRLSWDQCGNGGGPPGEVADSTPSGGERG